MQGLTGFPGQFSYYASEDDQKFYSINENFRVGLRSAVDVLIPYQKGNCFYCNRPVNRFARDQDECFPDVDHFFPLSLLVNSPLVGVNPNGVWNLVIACMNCNRGPGGKFDAPPDSRFFEKLLYRNLLYVEEHNHSLKNSIMLSLGAGTKGQVLSRMKDIYEQFRMIRGWCPPAIW